MGGTISTGANNDELVDNLLEVGRIKSVLVERICRNVDRAFYFFPIDVNHAYKDFAWKRGNAHLSAPCIYSEVMENLDLEPGLSFLNIGSGTGYLSTMVGLVLGASGVNHGIELHEDVINYAHEKLELFKTTSNALDAFDFCEPVFVKGNSLNLKITRQYDRVYCGAECPTKYQPFINDLIKVGGVLVMPVEDTLMKYKRIDETRWVSASVLPVSFAPLIIPSPDEKMDSVLLPSVEPLSLQALCRSVIRNILRNNARKEYPEIEVMNRNLTGKKKSMHQCQWPASSLVPALHITPPIRIGRPLNTFGFEPTISGDSDSTDDSDNSSISSIGYLFRDPHEIVDEDSNSSFSSGDSNAKLNETSESVKDGAESSSPKKSSNKRESADSSDTDSDESEKGSVKKRSKRENLEAKRQKVHAFSFKLTNDESSSFDLRFTTGGTSEMEDTDQREQSTAREPSSLDISFSSASNEMEMEENFEEIVITKKLLLQVKNSDDSDSDDSGEESKIKKTKVERSDKKDKVEADSEGNAKDNCEEDKPSKSEPAITYSSVMKAKVKELPLPHALKCYLNYYREF